LIVEIGPCQLAPEKIRGTFVIASRGSGVAIHQSKGTLQQAGRPLRIFMLVLAMAGWLQCFPAFILAKGASTEQTQLPAGY